MINKNFTIPFLFTPIILAISACGGSDNSSPQPSEQAKFSLGISDAPIDEADSVFIEIDEITISGTETTVITEFTNDNNEIVETIKVNLLDFQGTDQLKIVDEAQGVTMAPGTYSMELLVVDTGSYVLLENDATEYSIKVPSSRLRLGDFEIASTSIQVGDTPAYTIEFSLRESLVMRGNTPTKNGFIIKPHGVHIVSEYGTLKGNVSADNTNLGSCIVYLYEGEPTELGDSYDADDETFVGDAPTATAPLISTLVAVDGTYSIGFVPTGSYTVALMCGTDIDDNIQYNALTIPSPVGNVATVGIIKGDVKTVDF
ncbi:hypothetical protein A3Q34_09990 [Colwellia sp. PAMC 20917]|uniref:DUF4382 domain-containing protein n=1 Tax=Colwellia sp. PAMC 20917 TaxID=1816218 RepID=UPI000878E1ED|nr:DUF4382 domain-containing protein [Colwellia sp. PAMC 20917]AOW77156.1 hypothetical protein A3Q34_09990 [Colwellia sp. PAMC 20917]